eukprot:TRINITY_DN1924_c0_g1_i2.p1 TRINITY_DN1924_c0_g1~~TRINITY_DN1924_c0_g1_i2.p1  ORF type:complete len:269 (-),score=49.47 TRINITY_DN1924_c0_g1_i2:35-841(-)
MGGSSSKKKKKGEKTTTKTFHAIADRYKSLSEVQDALRAAGLESSNLIVGVDYTKSNTWNGKNTFGGQNLHLIRPATVNPYQEVIAIVGKTLEPFDDDKLIPCFGFGDVTTQDKTVFPYFPDRPCYGFSEVLSRYNEITPALSFSGPTSFAPLIRAAIEIVKQQQSYHILVIIADGQVDNVKETSDAIVDATNYPLSIITVGVGDGPWDLMEEFDDKLPKRRFDNFQFVPYYNTMERAENREVSFGVAALQEVPEQYKIIKKLGLLGK